MTFDSESNVPTVTARSVPINKNLSILHWYNFVHKLALHAIPIPLTYLQCDINFYCKVPRDY